MKNKFKRYDLFGEYEMIEMAEDDDGSYVKYDEAKSALESANAENERLAKKLINIAIEHPCYKLSKELESENANLAKQVTQLSEANMNLRAALEEINTGVMSMYLDKGHMIDSFKKVAREALEKLK